MALSSLPVSFGILCLVGVLTILLPPLITQIRLMLSDLLGI
jgi:hypothetical protein